MGAEKLELRELITLLQDLGSIGSTHTAAHILCDSSSRDLKLHVNGAQTYMKAKRTIHIK